MATVKQLNLAKALVENGGRKSGQDLLIEAGYSPKSAYAHQKRTMQATGFVEILNKAGLTDTLIAKRLREGVNARNGKKADLRLRHTYIETAMKAKGLLKDSPTESLGSLADLSEKLKTFNIDFIIHIRQRLEQKKDAIDVTPRAS